MTISEWLILAKKQLSESGIDTPLLDAEILIANRLNRDRSWVNAHDEDNINQSNQKILDRHLTSRAKHTPIAYILGFKEFYGREFIVSKNTLTPRPETEDMIELTLDTVKKWNLNNTKPIHIVDMGTGSGCIIISVALEIDKISNLTSPISYCGLDISDEALNVASQNADALRADIDFSIFDLLSDSPSIHTSNNRDETTVILANLPYVPNDYEINKAAAHEPPVALFGGDDGLDYYRILFKKYSSPNTIILTESLEFQHEEMIKIANENNYTLRKTQGLIQIFIKTK